MGNPFFVVQIRIKIIGSTMSFWLLLCGILSFFLAFYFVVQDSKTRSRLKSYWQRLVFFFVAFAFLFAVVWYWGAIIYGLSLYLWSIIN